MLRIGVFKGLPKAVQKQPITNRFRGESLLSISHREVTLVGHSEVTNANSHNLQSICHRQEVLDE